MKVTGDKDVPVKASTVIAASAGGKLMLRTWKEVRGTGLHTRKATLQLH